MVQDQTGYYGKISVSNNSIISIECFLQNSFKVSVCRLELILSSMLVIQQACESDCANCVLHTISPDLLFLVAKKIAPTANSQHTIKSIKSIDLSSKIIKTQEQEIPFKQIIQFNGDLPTVELDAEQILKWYVHDEQYKQNNTRLGNMKSVLNQRTSTEDIYGNRICRDRSFINEAIFKVLLMSFAVFCLFQYYICRLLLVCMRPINWLTSWIGYVFLINIQNQLIFKANLIGKYLAQNLKGVFQCKDYRTVLKSYLRVMNIICFVLLDSALGLISLLATHTFIRNLLRILKYVTVTVHLAFVNGRIWTSQFKQAMCFNSLCEYADTILSVIIEYSNKYLKMDLQSLSQGYVLIAYIGFSFQILLTLELSYLLSVNIFLLYKLIAKLYQYSINAISLLYSIIKSTQKNNLTKEIPTIYLKPGVKIVCTMVLVIVVSVLPAIVLYYLWFIGSVVLFRILTVIFQLKKNLMMALLNIFNRLPLISFLETLKKPYLYPSVMIWKDGRIQAKPVSRLRIIFELGKKTFKKVKSIISIRMLKNILQGGDLIQQEKLFKLSEEKLNVTKLFRQLVRL